jgi:hypothetical protein
LDGHLRAAAGVSEPAPAGRIPPQRAAAELTLPVCRWRRFALVDRLVVVVPARVMVGDSQDLDEAEGGPQPPQGRRLVGVDLGHRPAG